MKKFNLVIRITVLIILTSLKGYSQLAFEEQAGILGVDTSYGMGEFGGGVSFCDYNNDGWDDITVSSENGSPILFFKNNNGTFVADPINISDDNIETKQVQWVDFDNDGDKDLFVTSSTGLNKLYENDGNFNMTDITVASGLNLTATNSWGSSWGDYNNDGYLDLFICFRKFGDTQPNALFKNNGDDTFTNVSIVAGINQINDPTFCAAFFDYNNDGWQDIFVTNHKFEESYLYKNNGDETFTDVSEVSGADIIADGMSTTVGDYNNDGFFDIYVTNNPPGNFHLLNNGDGTFTNVASGVGTGFYSVAWGSVFLDADNDSDLDLYVSGMLDGSTTLPSAFYENLGNNIFSIPLNIGFQNDTSPSFSNAIGDVDNDGLPDIYVINENSNNYLWKNTTQNSNNWLKVNLEGTNSNRDGVGSIIEVFADGKAQFRYTVNGEGYIAQNSTSEFFGMSAVTTIDYVKVTWLSGIEDTMLNVGVNQTISIKEGEHTLNSKEITFNEFNVYPNPSKGIFNIELEHFDLDRTLAIFDILGKEIGTPRKLNNKSSVVDLKGMSAGIYFFKVFSKNKVIVKKVILN